MYLYALLAHRNKVIIIITITILDGTFKLKGGSKEDRCYPHRSRGPPFWEMFVLQFRTKVWNNKSTLMIIPLAEQKLEKVRALHLFYVRTKNIILLIGQSKIIGYGQMRRQIQICSTLHMVPIKWHIAYCDTVSTIHHHHLLILQYCKLGSMAAWLFTVKVITRVTAGVQLVHEHWCG